MYGWLFGTNGYALRDISLKQRDSRILRGEREVTTVATGEGVVTQVRCE